MDSPRKNDSYLQDIATHWDENVRKEKAEIHKRKNIQGQPKQAGQSASPTRRRKLPYEKQWTQTKAIHSPVQRKSQIVKQGTIVVEHRNENERKLGYIKDPYAKQATINLDLTQNQTCPLTNIDKGAVSSLQHDVDMDEIPFYLRESIQRIIDKRVQIRIDEEMAALKDEIKNKLKMEKEQNQEQITTNLYEITGRPNTVHIANPKLEGTELEWANDFQKGDPRVMNHVGAVHPMHGYNNHPGYRGHPNHPGYRGYPNYPRGPGGPGYGYGNHHAGNYPGNYPYQSNVPYGELHDGYQRGYAMNVSPIRAITKRGDQL